jgi:hypothetical protein
MKTGSILAALTVAFVLYAPPDARAFECPTHFAAAQAMIDKVTRDMESMKGEMPENSMIHSLLDYADMYLGGAKHNHEKPEGPSDHARAIAKADSALGYARAADLMRARMSKM